MATKNCLVTRLRALVDDDSLEILDDGTIRFSALTSTVNGEKIVILGCAGPVELNVVGATIKGVYGDITIQDVEGNTYRFNGNSYTQASGFIINEDLRQVSLLVKSGLENITYIYSPDIDIDYIPAAARQLFLTSAESPVIEHEEWNLSRLPLRQMSNLSDIRSRTVAGDISALQLLPNKQSLISAGLYGATSLVGDITNLSVFPAITSLNLSGAATTGTVESFVAAFVDAGRTSGRIAIGRDLGTSTTFDGDLLGGSNTFNKILTWSTSGDSITITILRDSDQSVWKTKTITKNA